MFTEVIEPTRRRRIKAIIITQTGISLYHQSWDPTIQIDQDLFAGLMNAVLTLARQSIIAGGNVRVFQTQGINWVMSENPKGDLQFFLACDTTLPLRIAEVQLQVMEKLFLEIFQDIKVKIDNKKRYSRADLILQLEQSYLGTRFDEFLEEWENSVIQMEEVRFQETLSILSQLFDMLIQSLHNQAQKTIITEFIHSRIPESAVTLSSDVFSLSELGQLYPTFRPAYILDLAKRVIQAFIYCLQTQIDLSPLRESLNSYLGQFLREYWNKIRELKLDSLIVFELLLPCTSLER
ncbi:MAG: hypothetical protein ACFFC7_02600 [Candidatus Hermodarchaeota archaeon]